jgi:hypothetical protein
MGIVVGTTALTSANNIVSREDVRPPATSSSPVSCAGRAAGRAGGGGSQGCGAGP